MPWINSLNCYMRCVKRVCSNSGDVFHQYLFGLALSLDEYQFLQFILKEVLGAVSGKDVLYNLRMIFLPDRCVLGVKLRVPRCRIDATSDGSSVAVSVDM